MAEKELKSLELRIISAMKNIKEGKQTPKETEIAKMLNALKELDAPSYEKHFEMYKPISKAYFDEYKASPEYKKILAEEERKKKLQRQKDEDFALAIKSAGGSGAGFDDDVTSGPRVVKEVKTKVKKEPKVKVPKAAKQLKEKGDRDHSTYTFNGESYGKGPLFLAVVREHVRLNPKITFETLKVAFPDVLLPGYGIFQTYDVAMAKSKQKPRYFLKDNQLVRLKSGNIAVCNQISIYNFTQFLAHARKIGYKID